MKTFIPPSFLNNQSVDEIHARMLESLPENIDKGEGGWPWDFTRPTAIEKAQLVQFILNRAIQNTFPQFADDDIIVDYHAENRGMIRKAATHASATLIINGVKKTEILKGYKFSTPATLDAPGVEFLLDETVEIPESGVVEAKCTAILDGRIGNVAAETITMMVSPQKGIISINNPVAAYGGFEEESTESLRERIAEYDRNQGASFVGAISDYRRWAMSVEGVGNVKVIPAEDDSGLVVITVTDMLGGPADDRICKDIYHFIMREDAPIERLAPINAHLDVRAPDVKQIWVSADVELEKNYDLKMIKTAFVKDLIEYLKTITQDGNEVKYTRVGAVLSRVKGVSDFTNLLVCDDVENILIGEAEMPVVNESKVVLT